jgi:hypothetical protein
VNLKGAKLIDFTGSVGGEAYDKFCDAVTQSLRSPHDTKVVVVVDRGFGFQTDRPHVVKDHLNFTGHVPLVGPNDTIGERFPVVNNIYVTEFTGDALSKLPSGIAGGLKQGVKPAADEAKRLYELGADFFCYNMVQTMVIAAHAGWKVVGVLVPENAKLDGDLIAELKG